MKCNIMHVKKCGEIERGDGERENEDSERGNEKEDVGRARVKKREDEERK